MSDSEIQDAKGEAIVNPLPSAVEPSASAVLAPVELMASQNVQSDTPRAISPGPDPEELYLQGMSFLCGAGAAKNEGVAIAKFLDASDLGHAGGAFKAALMYFNGVGITRNDEEARSLAKRCLDLAPPSSLVQRYCAELMNGSIGTENVRRLLEQDEETVLQSDEQAVKKKKSILMLIAVAGVVIVLALAGAFFYLQAQDKLDSPPKAGITDVISSEEIAQSKKDALSIIAKLRADAAGAVQEAGDATPRGSDF